MTRAVPVPTPDPDRGSAAGSDRLRAVDAAPPPVPIGPTAPVRGGPDGACTAGAAAFLATLAEYEGCAVERLDDG